MLLAAQGLQNTDIAVQVGVGRVQVSRWRERYSQSRLAGIERGSVALTFSWVFAILYVVIYFKNTLSIVSVI